jgi:hypothetical protein
MRNIFLLKGVSSRRLNPEKQGRRKNAGEEEGVKPARSDFDKYFLGLLNIHAINH